MALTCRFFRPQTPAACALHPVELDVALDKSPPAGGDRRRVDAEQLSDTPVAAPPALEGFESGEQTPLPLVKQAVPKIATPSSPWMPHTMGHGDF